MILKKKALENTVGKGENAGNQHFLLFPHCFPLYYPITRRQISDSSKMKDFAYDNLKFEENGRKLFKPVENTVGKGEIAPYEQFLLFPQCFQKACFPGASKGVIVWEWVKERNHHCNNVKFVICRCFQFGHIPNFVVW